MGRVIVIGAGAAGMAAAVAAAENGHHVSVYEKNNRVGRKLSITGKGRCNVTNASDMKVLMEQVKTNARFLYSAFHRFGNEDLVRLLAKEGCETKVERGMRVFPVSDKSSDVLAALTGRMKKAGISLYLDKKLQGLILFEGRCRGIFLADKLEPIRGDAVILCTGGLSYPGTGSTGDGYRMAREAGHRITPLMPSLVPFVLKEDVGNLSGLSLKNVGLTLLEGEKILYREQGEMLFTHFGLSGPLVLSASAYGGSALKEGRLSVVIDLKPALSEEKLDLRVLRDFSEHKNKTLKNALGDLLLQKLIPEVLKEAGLSESLYVNDLSREARKRLIFAIKNLRYFVAGTRGYNEAIITKGGVDVKEVNPSTMESKICRGLYFAGEILDVDALTGGYNLQIAWSTGWTAGGSIDV